MTRLGDTGQIYVTWDAAESAHAEHDRWHSPGAAARELTALLLDATAGAGDRGMWESPERWRFRRKSVGLDITARVTRQGRLAVVESISVRALNQSRGRER
jgi:hypothetical protein